MCGFDQVLRDRTVHAGQADHQLGGNAKARSDGAQGVNDGYMAGVLR